MTHCVVKAKALSLLHGLGVLLLRDSGLRELLSLRPCECEQTFYWLASVRPSYEGTLQTLYSGPILGVHDVVEGSHMTE